jgi:hypothetical protein
MRPCTGEISENKSSLKRQILRMVPTTTKKHQIQRHKEYAHMSLIDHPTRQPSLDVCPIWTPVITAEVQCTLSGKIYVYLFCFYVVSCCSILFLIALFSYTADSQLSGVHVSLISSHNGIPRIMSKRNM